MSEKSVLSRRDFLRGAAAISAGGLLAACAAPTPEVIMEQVVVKETVMVEGESVEVTKIVEREVEVEVEVEVTAPPTPEEKLLRMTQGSFWAERFQPTVERFRDKYPEVEVEFISVSGMDHEEVYAKILSMFAAGENIDTVNTATEGTQVFAGKELAIPLDDFVKADEPELKEFFSDVHPLMPQGFMYEGSLYGMPWRWNGANMFLNTRMFDEAGIGYPDADWTKEDFYDIAKALSKGEGADRQYGYGWINRLWGSWMPWIFANAEPFGPNLLTVERAPGGRWFWDMFYKDDPQAEHLQGGQRWVEPTANIEGNVEALEFMVQLYQEGITPTVEVGGGGTLQGFLTADKLAMSPGGGFWAGGLAGAGMEVGSFDVVNFPKWKSQALQIGVAGDLLIGYSKLKEEAWAMMKELSTLETHATIAEGNTTTVVRRSFHNAEQYASTGPEHWNVFYDSLDLPGTSSIPSPPEAQEITVMFVKYTSLAMSLDVTPREALDGLQEEMEELLERKRGE